MTVTYLIEFAVKPDQRDRFLTLLNGVLDAMRDEPMFHQATLHVDPENENRMVLHETWENHDDVLQVQITRPYREAWHAALPELIEGDRKISVLRPLRSDRNPARP